MACSDPSNFEPFLKRLTARSVLTDEERQAILALPGYAFQVRSNHDFVRLGEEVSHACLVVEGNVARFGQTARGDRQITAFHLPGDMANLHSVVRPVGTSGLQALTTTLLLKVPHSALRKLAGRYAAIAEAFWRDCTVDAAILAQWVVNVGRRDSRTRIAHLMCELAIRYGAGDGAVRVFPLPCTQQHLADATGLTPVHVNRTLRSLREDDLLQFTNREARIADWSAMARLADFDGDYLQADCCSEKLERVLAPA